MDMRVSIGGELTALPGLPDLAVPQLTAEVNDPEISYDLVMQIAMVHGKPVCTSLTAGRREGGPPVTRQGLNSLPVNRLVRQAVSVGMTRKAGEGPGFRAWDWPAPPGAAESALRELARSGGRPADGSTQDRMHEAVTMYRDLLGLDPRPTTTIARELQISVSYASQLLTRARKQGLLGAAIPGRAGEAEGPGKA
jgi:hypothetical protein